YTGGIANTGLQAFRVVATSIDSTPVTGTLICSDSLARAGGGATPTPFVPSTPAAGNCIGISTPPAAGTIAYTCATPTTAPSPQVTSTACAAAPSVGPGPLINIPAGCNSGSFVTLQSAGTPSPQTGAAGVTDRLYAGVLHGSTLGTSPCLASNAGDVVANTSASGGSCLVKGTALSWQGCNEVSVTHCYRLSDAAPCNT